MGYMRHHCIIVTSFDDEALIKAHRKAMIIFPEVTPITPSGINGYRSFFIPPDGSKEGWADSNEGDERREEFVAYLRSKPYNCLDWVELQYADDEGNNKIINEGG